MFCGVVPPDFTHIFQGYFTGTETIIRVPSEITLMDTGNLIVWVDHLYNHAYKKEIVCISYRIYCRGQYNSFWESSQSTWWRHQMETFSALLAICAGNSPVPGEFPSQRPVTRSFDVFFDLCPNKRLSRQSWGWWFETPSGSLWRHSNDRISARLHYREAYDFWTAWNVWCSQLFNCVSLFKMS